MVIYDPVGDAYRACRDEVNPNAKEMLKRLEVCIPEERELLQYFKGLENAQYDIGCAFFSAGMNGHGFSEGLMTGLSGYFYQGKSASYHSEEERNLAQAISKLSPNMKTIERLNNLAEEIAPQFKFFIYSFDGQLEQMVCTQVNQVARILLYEIQHTFESGIVHELPEHTGDNSPKGYIFPPNDPTRIAYQNKNMELLDNPGQAYCILSNLQLVENNYIMGLWISKGLTMVGDIYYNPDNSFENLTNAFLIAEAYKATDNHDTFIAEIAKILTQIPVDYHKYPIDKQVNKKTFRALIPLVNDENQSLATQLLALAWSSETLYTFGQDGDIIRKFYKTSAERKEVEPALRDVTANFAKRYPEFSTAVSNKMFM